MIPVSVIIPVYNAESFLKESINSVLNQSFADFELLALDDGSTDRSPEVIRSFDDKRIRYIPCKHDFIGTLNKGLKYAQGKYIAQLDHDDIMLPKRLQIQYDFMEANPNIAACGGYMEYFGKYSGIRRLPLTHDELLPFTIIHSPIFNPTGFIRREVLIQYGIKHRRGYSFAEDFKFWTDMAKVEKLANIPEVLTQYRTSDQQANVKYKEASAKASYAIQCDMIDYFFSYINKENSVGKSVLRQLVPALRKLGELDIFSAPVYFDFMYEMIYGLRKKGIINV